MSALDFHALDSAIWELSEAFSNFPDADLWTRPHPNLLSAGETATHIAYWEAQSFLGPEFETPLLIEAAQYYTASQPHPFQLALGAEALYAEVKRIHEACKAAAAAANPDSEDPSPFREGWTWGYVLEYQAFHVAYHTGQIYSVRHLLGHETPDN